MSLTENNFNTETSRAMMKQQIANLTRQRDEAVRERDELRAIIERIPLTADGVRLFPGDTAYLMGPVDFEDKDDDPNGEWFAHGDPGEPLVLSLGSTHDYEDYDRVENLYSTQEASIEGAKEWVEAMNEAERDEAMRSEDSPNA